MSYNEVVISILSYNIELGRNIEEIIGWVHSKPKYDIICFQEFPEENTLSLTKHFPSYNSEFVISISRRKKHYGQLTLFERSKFKLIDKQIINIGPSLSSKLLYKNKIDRNILITTFNLDGKSFILANIHLTPITWNKRKLAQIQKVISLMDNLPTVLVGDFNYSSLMNLKRLTDLLGRRGFVNNTSKIITHHKFIIRHQLDYIFSKECNVKDVKVEKIQFSDHFPISANLT